MTARRMRALTNDVKVPHARRCGRSGKPRLEFVVIARARRRCEHVIAAHVCGATALAMERGRMLAGGATGVIGSLEMKQRKPAIGAEGVLPVRRFRGVKR